MAPHTLSLDASVDEISEEVCSKNPRKRRLRRRPKRGEHYTVYHACGRDTSCLLNPFDIVPTAGFSGKEKDRKNNPYLVITDTHVLKWHHLKLLNTSFVEVYCTNTCCVLSPVNAAIYIDAVGRCASEDTLLGLLHTFQGHGDGWVSSSDDSDDDSSNKMDKLDTMFFRMIYRIPLVAFSPTFALEKKSFSYFPPEGGCTMESCKMIQVPSWLWWFTEESENLGVCNSPLAKF